MVGEAMLDCSQLKDIKSPHVTDEICHGECLIPQNEEQCLSQWLIPA